MARVIFNSSSIISPFATFMYNVFIFLSLSLSLSVSPSSYNLVQGEIPSNARRALTLISKVLQNLANHVLFKKEAHMKVFNEFLADNFERSRE